MPWINLYIEYQTKHDEVEMEHWLNHNGHPFIEAPIDPKLKNAATIEEIEAAVSPRSFKRGH